MKLTEKGRRRLYIVGIVIGVLALPWWLLLCVKLQACLLKAFG